MTEDWFEQSFGQDYLTVYKHRDMQGAYEEVRRMIAWLELPHGAEIFDLCCGMGRHSLALVDFGFHVTGMDLSEVLLTEARKTDNMGKVRWIRGDMRNVPVKDQFDAVVNLFTSFGYFTDHRENAAVIGEIGRLLRPHGKFIIDFLNAGHVAAHLVPRSERRVDEVEIIEERAIEDGFVRKRITIREDGRPERHYLEQVRLYRLDDFRSMLADAGLSIVHVYGNYAGDPYNETDSPRLILVGAKSAVEETEAHRELHVQDKQSGSAEGVQHHG